MSFNVRHNTLAAKKNDYFQNIASGQITSRENWGGSVDEVYTISPTSILNLRLNYTYMYESATDSSEGFDPTSLGFPSYIGANTVRPSLPYVYFDTSTAFQSLGYNQAANASVAIGSALRKLDQAQGQSQLQGGHRSSPEPPEHHHLWIRSGGYNFGGNRWVNQNASASQTEAMGQDMAQFLYGLPTQGFFDINTFGSWYSYFVSGFVQDDWRVKRNLTAQPRPALRLRRSRQREVRAHGKRLGLRHAEPDRAGRHRRLQPEADRADSGGQFQRARRADLSRTERAPPTRTHRT